MVTSEKDKEGFITIGRSKQKKRKADASPVLQTPPGSNSASTPGTTTHPKTPNFDFPNSTPLIIGDVDPKFTNVKLVMSELRQYPPDLRVSRVKDLPNNKFLVIGNTLRDVIILQSEIKMKVSTGQNVKISLPKAYQIKSKSKTLVVKWVPTDFTDEEFKIILDSNKINCAKAERMKSRGDGR